MAKYRKKPVVVEAFKFYKDDMPDWFMDKVTSNEVILRNCNFNRYSIDEASCEINTLEGTMTANGGDYIIKGVQGEIYPCKPDIFEVTYELEPAEERWNKAIEHAKFMLEEYKQIPSGVFGTIGIANDIARYENGERTKELLEALEGIN